MRTNTINKQCSWVMIYKFWIALMSLSLKALMSPFCFLLGERPRWKLFCPPQLFPFLPFCCCLLPRLRELDLWPGRVWLWLAFLFFATGPWVPSVAGTVFVSITVLDVSDLADGVSLTISNPSCSLVKGRRLYSLLKVACNLFVSMPR